MGNLTHFICNLFTKTVWEIERILFAIYLQKQYGNITIFICHLFTKNVWEM